jgi:hypothetical protein
LAYQINIVKLIVGQGDRSSKGNISPEDRKGKGLYKAAEVVKPDQLAGEGP